MNCLRSECHASSILSLFSVVKLCVFQFEHFQMTRFILNSSKLKPQPESNNEKINWIENENNNGLDGDGENKCVHTVLSSPQSASHCSNPMVVQLCQQLNQI